MRRTLNLLLAPLLIGAVTLYWLWGSPSATDTLLHYQKAAQNALAGAVRAIKGGDPLAWVTLLAVTFSYGFLHAVGPGHGKAVIGAYGVARRVSVARITLVALASSMAQSAFAIVLVLAGAVLLGLSREHLEAWSETILLPVSWGLLAALGLWLFWRGARGLAAKTRTHAADAAIRGSTDAHDDHVHTHHHGVDCGCGHDHGPSLEQLEQIGSFRDALLVIFAVAIRPCSGALFLLVLTLALGIPAAGILGVLAMGVGTASVTIAVAILAVSAREGAFSALPMGAISRAIPMVEFTAGAVISVLSLTMIIQTV